MPFKEGDIVGYQYAHVSCNGKIYFLWMKDSDYSVMVGDTFVYNEGTPNEYSEYPVALWKIKKLKQ